MKLDPVDVIVCEEPKLGIQDGLECGELNPTKALQILRGKTFGHFRWTVSNNHPDGSESDELDKIFKMSSSPLPIAPLVGPTVIVFYRDGQALGGLRILSADHKIPSDADDAILSNVTTDMIVNANKPSHLRRARDTGYSSIPEKRQSAEAHYQILKTMNDPDKPLPSDEKSHETSRLALSTELSGREQYYVINQLLIAEQKHGLLKGHTRNFFTTSTHIIEHFFEKPGCKVTFYGPATMLEGKMNRIAGIDISENNLALLRKTTVNLPEPSLCYGADLDMNNLFVLNAANSGLELRSLTPEDFRRTMGYKPGYGLAPQTGAGAALLDKAPASSHFRL